jgi:hypothetical protein
VGDQKTNAQILAQLALLGAPENRLEDFILNPERGPKLINGLNALDPSVTGFKNEDIYSAAQGLCRLTEALLSHLIEKYKDQDRVKNLMASGKLLLQFKSGPIIDHKSLNRVISTFYLDWPYAAHWRRDLYRIPEAGLTVTALVFGGLQKLRDLIDEQAGLG